MRYNRFTQATRFALSTSVGALTMAGMAATPAYAKADPAPTAAPVVVAQAEAAADDAPKGDKDIVVTGSRIAQRGLNTSSPLQQITSADLDARGFQTVAQALNELPTFGVPGASPVGFNQSGFGAGQSFVNFLGLGSQRTLTLVNGKRFVSSNTSSIFGPTGSGGNQVDLNVIPTKLIDRVETVAAIGAPIYGSDAIAGTVNIILKRDYQGFDLDAQAGLAAAGDAPDYRFRLLAGRNFAGGRGNITIAGEYDESKGLFFTDRSATASDDRFANNRNGLRSTSGSLVQVIYNDFRVPSVDPYGIPIVGGAAFGLDFPLSPQQSTLVFGAPQFNFGVTNASGAQLRFDPSGALIPIDFGSTVGPDNAFNVFTSGGNAYTLRSVENLLTDLKRYSINVDLSYELTDNIRLYSEGWYSVSQGRNLADQPAYNVGLFGSAGARDGSLIIPLSNPFLPAAARSAIVNSIQNNPFSDQNYLGVNQDYFYLGRANIDLSTGVSTGKSELIRFVGGAEGTLRVLPGKDWHFDAYFTYGRAKVTSRNPELNERNFLNALDAVRDSNGNIVCRPGYTNSPVATISSVCAPLDLFGAQVSSAARDYVTTIATPTNVNNQYDAVLSVAGPLASLPGGDLAFALGYEHRAEDSRFDPGQFYRGATTDQYPGVDFDEDGDPVDLFYGRSVPILPVFGKYHTNEIFGELNANIISPSNNIPLVHELSVQTAGRYIWNSQAGAAPTYTFQGRYAPVEDITFRAAFTRAVRAPSITEAFNPTSSAFGFATDPCDQTQVNIGPDPATRRRNCAAAGVPTNFTSLSNQRSIFTYVFGNSALTNEKADSFTAGVVLSPRFFPGFHATVDYIDITLTDAISQFSNTQVASACYDSTSYPSNTFCGLVERDATTHQLTRIGTSYFNSARLRYKGIVAEVTYRHATDFLGRGSHMGLKVSYQYLDTLSTVVTSGARETLTSNSPGYSPNKGVATVTYDNGGFLGQIQVNYIGKTRVDPNSALDFYSVPYVNSFTYVNLSLSQNVGKQFTIHADVDNLFNAKVPYPYPASGGTTTYFQGILGTYIRIGAAVHF